MYMLLLLEVHFFPCDLNLLYEDLISLVFILASFLQLRKTRNRRPAKFSTNEVVALYGMLFPHHVRIFCQLSLLQFSNLPRLSFLLEEASFS